MWVSERSEWFNKTHVWVLHCVKSDSWLSVSDRTFVRAWLVSEVVVGCWRDGTRMWCELLWRLPPPMLCDHWCCLVCPDIASWSLGTRSPQNLGLTKYFGCFMVNYEFTSADIMSSDEAGSWIPYFVSVSPQIKYYVGNSASLNSQGRKLIIDRNYKISMKHFVSVLTHFRHFYIFVSDRSSWSRKVCYKVFFLHLSGSNLQ